MRSSTAQRRRLWANRTAAGLCVYCGQHAPLPSTKHCKGCLDKKLAANLRAKSKHHDRSVAYRRRVRKEVIDKYGGVCFCCGETNLLFLTIDHVNNDGKADRLGLTPNGPSSTSVYFRLRREPMRSDLRVLCFNCNLGRAANGGVCPHKKPLTDKDIYPEGDLRKARRLGVREKVAWPPDADLVAQLRKTTLKEVAATLGVSGQAVAARLKRRGLYPIPT